MKGQNDIRHFTHGDAIEYIQALILESACEDTTQFDVWCGMNHVGLVTAPNYGDAQMLAVIMGRSLGWAPDRVRVAEFGG